MNIAELAILSPLPLFPDDPFWDGQPRESNGRFASGKMPGSYLRCSASTVTIEQAADGRYRFHHLRLNRENKNAPP